MHSVCIEHLNQPLVLADWCDLTNVLSLTGCLSIGMNLMVLAMFVRFPDLLTSTNVLILHLALTDVGVSSLGYPLSAASAWRGQWSFGWIGCQIYAAVNIFFGMASIALLTLVAVDRYLIICRPHRGDHTIFAAPIVLAWCNALFWATAPLFGWAAYAPDPTGTTCTVHWRHADTSFMTYTLAVVFVNFVIPFGAMCFCYGQVWRSLRHRHENSTNKACVTAITDLNNQRAVTKMSMMMIAAFLVAWSPYAVICLWASFGNPHDIPGPMAIIAPLFAKSSTFYNPIIYISTNACFRKALMHLLRCHSHQAFTLNHSSPCGSQIPLT
uniref:Retinal pigment epithelium-derived rhodopsin homolog n=1 Tax=Eptatretus burgeri TaxID=7764 RepID=A0A8C4R7M2_EPTBU